MKDNFVFADAFNYLIYNGEQVINPHKLHPLDTIAIGVPYGADKWDGPMSLHEMMSVKDERILSFIPDYQINLIVPSQMSDEEIDRFTTNLRGRGAC